MSAALKTESVSLPSSQSAAQPATRRRSLKVIEPPVAASVIVPLQNVRDRPLWLKLLVAGQRLSLVVAGLTVTGALSAYALTVDANRRLTTATATLGRLQDHQQQLITANAVFKNHLAQTAIAALNDGTLHPKDVIFLEGVEPPLESSLPETQASPSPSTDRRFFPKGY